jgi:hypothetical protein
MKKILAWLCFRAANLLDRVTDTLDTIGHRLDPPRQYAWYYDTDDPEKVTRIDFVSAYPVDTIRDILRKNSTYGKLN